MIQLNEECIILELQASNKEELLRELAIMAQRNCPEIETTTIIQILLEREQVGSTGVGNGVAIPHGKLPDIEEQILCFGKSNKGISFDAKDERSVHLFVMILSPLHMSEKYLQTLGKVSKLLKDEETRNKFLRATSTQTVQQLFNRP